MGIASIIVGVLSFLFMLGGVFFTGMFVVEQTWMPALAALFSFGAPILALAAIVLGGIATSRARRDGESAGSAIAGIVVGGVAFIPAVLVALTCGLCNAMCSAGSMAPHRDGGARWWLDAGRPPARRVGDDQDPRVAPPPPGAWADGGAAAAEPEPPDGGGSDDLRGADGSEDGAQGAGQRQAPGAGSAGGAPGAPADDAPPGDAR